jgi:hypothetical protein
MYTLLLQKNNSKTRRFNYSTYVILQKAFILNRNKAEFKAMLKRIRTEMKVAFHTRDFKLLVNYIALDLKVRLKVNSFI